MSFGKCALCHSVTELRRSHAIPDSFFRRLFSKGSGKAIQFVDDKDTEISYSNESWWEYQLCNSCEGLLNLEYEKYSINVFRGCGVEYTQHADGVVFSQCNNGKIVSFFTSIIWRAANSGQKPYEKIFLEPQENNLIRKAILLKEKVTKKTVAVKVSRLVDKTNGFTAQDLKSLIVSPFCRGRGKRKSFCIVLEGFLIEVFVPGLPVKERLSLGIINANSTSMFVPYLDVFDVAEVVSCFVSGYRINVEGLISFDIEQ